MTKREELQRDADGLIEALRTDWRELANGGLTPAQRAGIFTHIEWASGELVGLLDEMKALDEQ